MAECIVVTGLPRAGKDWIALLASEVTGARILGTDSQREKMVRAGIIPYQSRYKKVYMQLVYVELIAEAKDTLVNGGSVIIHATFCKKENRTRIYNLVRELGVLLHIINVECDEEVIKRRTEKGIPLKGGGATGSGLPSVYYPADYSEAGWDVYQAIKEASVPVENADLVIDGSLYSVENMNILNTYFNADRTPLLPFLA